MLQNFITKYKLIICAATGLLAVGMIILLCCGGKRQQFFELNCVYPDTNARYDFIVEDRNTAENFKYGFPENVKERGMSVNCGDVREYSGFDDDTHKILSKRDNVASALVHNPLGGTNYQVEYMTLGGDLIGYSCVYIDIRYDCFTDEPFYGCPEALVDAKTMLPSKCVAKEVR